MIAPDFYLIVETSWFTYTYLVKIWLERFAKYPSFKGLVIIEKDQSETLHQARKTFHQTYLGCQQIDDDLEKQLQSLYSATGVCNTEKAMIRLFGIPPYLIPDCPQTVFFSEVNSESAKQWLNEVCQSGSPPYFFLGMGQILKPWWIEKSQSQIINPHSAVLPDARGIYSIENIAATQDINKFKKSVGITVHYIDAGVDTGAIIQTKRLLDPFVFNSIWELKGYLYNQGFRLLADVTQDIISYPELMPIGVVHNPALRGPNFKQKDFTAAKQQQAEVGYLAMKAQVNPASAS